MSQYLKRALVYISFSCLLSINLHSTNYYRRAFLELNSMLCGKVHISFQRAVNIVENAYNCIELDQTTYKGTIDFFSLLAYESIASGNIEYSGKDKAVAMSQCAVFTLMTDSLPISIDGNLYKTAPFIYNHSDPLGQEDWSNTFVSTLIQTQKGNCHSLPYLYKMIMDELGQECHLALAPNHMYIKAKNDKVGWYNIELTCGDFPTDAWLMASGYIHLDAIRNGIYMRALSDKEAVSMTLVDLAQGYQAKFGIGDGSFMLQCCDTALEHFPTYINAMLLKGEILTELYRESPDEAKLEELTALYTTIHELGYRKMPKEMYTKWLGSLSKDNTDQRMKSIIIKN